MNNPYVSRGPVRTSDMFFGRSHVLSEIAAFVRGNQSISIVGSRKIGKTSVLFHLKRPEVWPQLGLEGDNLFIYLDCEVLGSSRHEEIFGQFAEEISLELEGRAPAFRTALGAETQAALRAGLDKVIEHPTRLSFEAAVRKLNQSGLRVVLMLDEFERLSTNPNLDINFFNALRSAAGRYQLVYLTASASPLIELTFSGRSQDILSSPFFNIFAPLFLGLFDEREARQLIRQPAQKAGHPFSPEIEEFLYGLVGGHPLALQVACFYALNACSVEGPVWDNASLMAQIERETLQELSAHFQYYWRNLSLAEQNALRQVTQAAARAPGDTTMRGVLRDLVHKGMLVADGNIYRYASHAWASFVAAQISDQAAARDATPTRLAGDGDATPGQVTSSGHLSGSCLGQYQVLDLVGRGGMAEVYRARHIRLDRVVAIKVLPASLAAEADFRERFEREARAVATLKHPNIVQIFDFGDSEGMYYMVMEYIAGKNLAQWLREASPLPWSQVRPLLHDLASALDYAHGQGLVHRDVKPSNVMLEAIGLAPAEDPSTPDIVNTHQLPIVGAQSPPSFRAVLTDFGIAKLLTGGTSATKTGMVGTLDYIAPEQIRSAREVDARADIYALGVMLYQMLSGRLPFSGDNPGAVLMGHLQTPPPDPREYVPDLPATLTEAILRALAKDPAERFATAGRLLQACD